MTYAQNPYYFGGAVPDQLSAYKQPYQPYFQAAMPHAPTVSQGNGMIFVQGETAAKSWAVAPGASVVLWDSEAPFIYIKSADASGIPSMRRIRWEDCPAESPQNAPSTNSVDFAPISAVKAMEEKIAALESRIEEFSKTKNAEGTE